MLLASLMRLVLFRCFLVSYSIKRKKEFLTVKLKTYNRPLSHGGHFESQLNKKLCFCPSSLALDERRDGQNLLFQHCVIKFYSAP